MRSWVRYLVVVVMGLLAGACATKIPAERLSAIRTIAVVPAIDPEFHYYFYGFLVFQNQHKTFDIADWKLEDHVFTETKRLLSPAYNIVRDTAIDRTAVIPSSFFEDRSAMVQRAVSTVKGQSAGIDAYLFLIRETGWTLWHNESYPVDNIGVLRRSIAARSPWVTYRQYCIYSVYRAFLVDARTGDLIGQRPAEIRQLPDQFGQSAWFTPIRDIAESDMWPKDADAMMDAERGDLENRTKALLSESLEYTYRAFGLLPAAPQ